MCVCVCVCVCFLIIYTLLIWFYSFMVKRIQNEDPIFKPEKLLLHVYTYEPTFKLNRYNIASPIHIKAKESFRNPVERIQDVYIPMLLFFHHVPCSSNSHEP